MATPGLDAAMARVGDRWSLLVVDSLLERPRRFSDLQSAIAGIAANVLSSRLRRLEQEGLLLAVRYSERPPRVEYQLSEAGRDLAGAVRLLAHWGARHGALTGTQGPVESAAPRHGACGTPLEARWYCPTCDRVADTDTGTGWDEVAWL